MIAFTTLIGGICAAAIGAHQGMPSIVLIGNVIEQECIWRGMLTDNQEVTAGRGAHSVKVKIGELSAIVIIDGKEYKVPMNNLL